MVNREQAKEYLEYLFEIGTFRIEYERVKLENCSIIDDTLILTIRRYDTKYTEYDKFTYYSKLEDFEIFVRTVIRNEKLDDLLEAKTNNILDET